MKKAMIIIAVVLVIIIVLLVIGKKILYTEIMINAPVESVWKEFSNFPEYPNWNPFLKKISGDMKPGSTINITIQPKGDKPVDFTPVIIKYEEKSILQWEGKLFIPGVFTGKHTFQLIRIDKDKTKFIQKEDFNGILVPFINLNATLDGFNDMNNLLKKRVEMR